MDLDEIMNEALRLLFEATKATGPEAERMHRRAHEFAVEAVLHVPTGPAILGWQPAMHRSAAELI